MTACVACAVRSRRDHPATMVCARTISQAKPTSSSQPSGRAMNAPFAATTDRLKTIGGRPELARACARRSRATECSLPDSSFRLIGAPHFLCCFRPPNFLSAFPRPNVAPLDHLGSNARQARSSLIRLLASRTARTTGATRRPSGLAVLACAWFGSTKANPLELDGDPPMSIQTSFIVERPMPWRLSAA